MLPKGWAACRYVYNSYRRNARKRGFAWVLPYRLFKKLIVRPCVYCGRQKSKSARRPDLNGDFRYTGLDRKNNEPIYHKDTVDPCCRNCNCQKGNLTKKEFLFHLSKVKSTPGF